MDPGSSNLARCHFLFTLLQRGPLCCAVHGICRRRKLADIALPARPLRHRKKKPNDTYAATTRRASMDIKHMNHSYSRETMGSERQRCTTVAASAESRTYKTVIQDQEAGDCASRIECGRRVYDHRAVGFVSRIQDSGFQIRQRHL